MEWETLALKTADSATFLSHSTTTTSDGSNGREDEGGQPIRLLQPLLRGTWPFSMRLQRYGFSSKKDRELLFAGKDYPTKRGAFTQLKPLNDARGPIRSEGRG